MNAAMSINTRLQAPLLHFGRFICSRSQLSAIRAPRLEQDARAYEFETA